MKQNDKTVTLDGNESVQHMLHVLDSDIGVFLKATKEQGQSDLWLLGSLYTCVNFGIACLQGRSKCYNHDDKKHPNRLIVFTVDADTIANYLVAAWNLLAERLNVFEIDYKMEVIR